MKRIVCLLTALVVLLCGCTQMPTNDNTTDTTKVAVQTTLPETQNNKPEHTFIKNENGNIVSDTGVEYVHLANGTELYHFGTLEFQGHVAGEIEEFTHLVMEIKTGMYSIVGSETDDILIRYFPNNEWFSIYRKASLPTFDYSLDGCDGFKYFSYSDYRTEEIKATSFDLSSPNEISDFLTTVRSQNNPKDAGLYELVTQPNGLFENCYTCGYVIGYFNEESNVYVPLPITSYNDLAYSIALIDEEYVLPEEYVQFFGLNK